MTSLLPLIVIFIFGASVGSFLNVVAYRSVHGGSIFFDRSKCPHCKHTLASTDLVPILSFVILRGRCRYCHKKLSWQYPVVELSTAFLFVITFYSLQPQGLGAIGLEVTLNLIYVLFLISVFIVIFVTDIKNGLIPDKVIFPSIVIAFVFKLILLLSSPISPITFLIYDIAAGLLAGAFFYMMMLVTGGRAMGGGDVKYAAFLGLALGFSGVVVALFLAFLTGALVSLILILVGKKRFGETVPFGPFLSIGAVGALIWGQQILDWYLKVNS